MNLVHPVVEEGKSTLIIVRRAPTEPKTALAGVMLETSFARFMASMATFNEERVPARLFDRWNFASMVQSQCGDKMTVTAGRAGCEERPATKDGRQLCHDTLGASLERDRIRV